MQIFAFNKIKYLHYCNSGVQKRHVSANYDDIVFNQKHYNASIFEKRQLSRGKRVDSDGVCHCVEIKEKIVELEREIFTKEQKKNYFIMLERNRASKKAAKFMRQSLRRVEKQIDLDSLLTDLTIEADFLPKFDNQYFSDEDIKNAFQSSMLEFNDIRDDIKAKIQSNPIYMKIRDVLPSKKDALWMVYVIILIYQLYKSQSLTTDILSLVQFMIVTNMFDKKDDAITMIVPLLWMMRIGYRAYNTGGSNDIVIEGSIADFIFKSRSATADFVTSHFTNSIRDIVLILASFHLFPQNVAKYMRDWLGRVDKPKSIPEAISRITTDIGNLINMAEHIHAGKPISEIFLEADPVLAAKEEANRLTLEFSNLYFGLPQEGKVDAITWIESARKVTRKIMAMQGKLGAYDARAEALRTVCSKLLNQIAEIVGRTRAAKRQTPAFFVIAGDPGIGKSSIVTLILQLWSKIKGREFSQSHVFERVAQSKFWDGYSAEGTPYIHISELGALKEEMVKAGLDLSALELTSIVDSLPFSLNMSKADEKGTNFCMPEVVICDTNNENLNIDVMVRNQAAFKRRQVVIIPRVKEQYRTDGGTGLDANKAKGAANPMDLWEFDVFIHIPINLREVKRVNLMNELPAGAPRNVFNMMSVLSKYMEEHIVKESSVYELFQTSWVEENFAAIAEARAALPIKVPTVFAKAEIVEEDLKEDESFLMVEHEDIDSEHFKFLIDTGMILPFDPHKAENKQRAMDAFKLHALEATLEYYRSARDLIGYAAKLRSIDGVYYFKSLLFDLYDRTDSPVNVEADFSVKAKFSSNLSSFVTAVKEKHESLYREKLSNDRIHGVGVYDVDGRVKALGLTPNTCDCCVFGLHNYSTCEKVSHTCKVGSSIVLNLTKSSAELYAFLSLNLRHVFAGMDDTQKVLFCLLNMIMFWFVPWFWVVQTLSLLASTFDWISSSIKRKADEVQEDFNQRLVYMNSVVNTNIEDFKGYCKRQQTLAIKWTVGIAAAISMVAIICGILNYVWNKKKPLLGLVESSFHTDNADIKRLERQELNLKMSNPHTRIRSANSKIKVYSNVISESERPVHTTGSLSEYQHNVAFRNVRPFMVSTDSYTRKGYALGLCSNLAVINKHYVDFTHGEFKLVFANSMNHLNENTGEYIYTSERIYTPKDIVETKDDMVILRMPASITVKNIIKHIPTTALKMKHLSVAIADTESIANDTSSIVASDSQLNRTFEQVNVASYSWPNHTPGMCGLPVVCEVQGGFYICGIHSSANAHDATSYMVKLDRTVIESLMKVNIEGSFSLNDAPDEEVYDIKTEEPSQRSFTRFVDQGPVQCYGKVHEFTGNQDSNIKLSVFGERDSFKEEMFDLLPEHEVVNFRQAMMKPRKNGKGEFKNPTTNGALKLCKQRVALDPIAMEKATSVLISQLKSNLEVCGVRRDYAPIDIETVLNGHPDDYLSRSVDKTKSAGFGYPGKKIKYMVSTSRDNVLSWDPSQKLAHDVANLIDLYSRGSSSRPVFKAALKDEVRPSEKYEKGNTRVFYATSFPFLVVQKAFMAPLYTLMIEHGKAFYAGLGIDMHREGHKLKLELIKFFKDHHSGYNCIEGDYGSFDTGMPYEIGEAACQVSYELLKWLGYNSAQLAIVKGILTDLMQPRVDFFGDLLLVPGLQPSGKYATAEDNSIRNLLILMYIWYKNDETKHLQFFENVLPTVYGDDVFGGVVDDVREVYNNRIIADGCKAMGLEFTDSSKQLTIRDFVDIDDLSFLKRTFRYHAELNREVAVLAPSSLMKTLQYIDPSMSIGAAEQYENICTSVLTEYFFWCDSKEQYDLFLDYLQTVLSTSFPIVNFSFPSFFSLLNRYKEGVENPDELSL